MYEGTTYPNWVQSAFVMIGSLIASVSSSCTPTRCVHIQQVYMTGESLSSFPLNIQLELIYLSIFFFYNILLSWMKSDASKS